MSARLMKPFAVTIRVVVPTLLACLLATSPAGGAADPWTYAQSDHFDIYTTAGDKRAREALVYFERVHAFFADFLKLSPKPLHPTRLIIFSNAREYGPYRLNEFATAYYAPGPDRDYIVMRSFDAESYPTVVHEYAHLIARHSGAIYPPWLNEGLAEFFSTMAPEAGQMSIGRVPLGRLRELTSGGPLIDLERLLAVDHSSPEYNSRNHAGMFYAQSWALTHMIMTADGYRQKSGVFLSAVAGGMPAATAFSSVLGKRVTEIFDDLRIYARNERFLYFTTTYRDPKASATSPARPATTFEARLVMANLLADRSGRQDQARQAYEALAQERPDDLELLEARGLFELRRGDRNTAQVYLARAVSAKSNNPSVYRWAASLSSSADERAGLLESAVALDPHDLDLRLTYASALTARRDPEAALRVLEPVARLTPEHAFMYFQLHANLNLQLGRLAAAGEAAAQAKRHARSERESAYADELVAQIARFTSQSAVADRAIRAENAAAPVNPAEPQSASNAPSQTATVSNLTGELLTVSAGRIRNLVCATTPPVLEVATAAGLVRLVIDDPLKIRIEGTGGPTTDLQCGQQDRPARIGYAPDAASPQKTVGALRLLDFR